MFDSTSTATNSVFFEYSIDIGQASEPPFTIIFRISSPYYRVSGDWACMLSQSGYENYSKEFYGVDSLQSLLNAVFVMKTLIEGFSKRGHELFYTGTSEILDISTHFSIFTANAAEQDAAANP